MKRVKTSKYFGVSTVKNSSKFVARIKVKEKNYFLGYYFLEVDAAKAYDYICRGLNKKNIKQRKLNFFPDVVIDPKQLSHKSNLKR